MGHFLITGEQQHELNEVFGDEAGFGLVQNVVVAVLFVETHEGYTCRRR